MDCRNNWRPKVMIKVISREIHSDLSFGLGYMRVLERLRYYGLNQGGGLLISHIYLPFIQCFPYTILHLLS